MKKNSNGSFMSKQGSGTPTKSMKKYDYRSYLESSVAPSDMAMQTAAKYGDKVASSAALQADIESNSRLESMRSVRRRQTCSIVRATFILLCLLQICGAAAVVVVTATQLDTTVVAADGSSSKAYCYLLNSSVNTCTYTYWAGGISIAVSFVLLLFNSACSGKRGHCCLSIEAILAICGVIWWIGAGTVSVITSDNASSQGLGEETARLALYIICFVVGGLFAGTGLLSCFGCCCRCCRDSKEDVYYD